MDITGVESPSAYEGLLNCDEKNPKPSIIAKQTRPELEERLEATLGIIVSCYKGRFCSWICRKINGSSRPDPGSLRWQNTASASEPQQNDIPRLLGFIKLLPCHVRRNLRTSSKT